MIRFWPYIAIGCLVVALSVSGLLLKHAWQAEAQAESQADQYEQALSDQRDAYAHLREQQERNNEIVADVAKQKQALAAKNRELSQALRNAPDASDEYTSCLATDLPGSVVDRLRSAGAGQNDN